MARKEQGGKPRGSQKWLQVLVNEHAELIDTVLASALQLGPAERVDWLSPVEADGYAEYRDQQFLDRLGITLEKVPLASFWPKNGPQWDGMARTSRGDIILVEAKAHIPEMVSDPTGAQGASLARIRESLEETKRFCGSHWLADWTTCFYQYTNRLAHLYLLRERNVLPAYLLNVYFVNDEEMGGPRSQDEWKGAIDLLESFLDIREHRLSPFIVTAFVDVARISQLTGVSR